MQRTVLVLVSLSCFCAVSADKETVSSRWKKPIASAAQVEAWQKEDEALHAFIRSKVPAVLEHTGNTVFDHHLTGVQSVLRRWGAPKHLSDAGLFHSLYGTEGFQGFALPLAQRDAIRDLIGEKAERLVWMFCMVDRSTVDKTVKDWTPGSTVEQYVFRSRPEFGRFEMKLGKEEWLDFVELNIADWLEQVEGASLTANPRYMWNEGEAYAYRRIAYEKMTVILAHERAERLADIVPKMYREVMDTESESTRHLVQAFTPPQSDASKVAIEALRSAGELVDFPSTLAPLAKEECKAWL